MPAMVFLKSRNRLVEQRGVGRILEVTISLGAMSLNQI